MDGFSGFEEDPEYTCNILVRDYNLAVKQGKEFDKYDYAKIPKNCWKEDGKLKAYVDSWEYLTTHYLIDHKPTKPLGHALFDNDPQNGMIFSGRGIGKSITIFIGDFLHEWFFGGVHRIEDVDKCTEKKLFGMASSDSRPLSRSIKAIEATLTRLPGSYRFPSNDKKERKTLQGPFSKETVGTWAVGNEIVHTIKDGTKVVFSGSIVQAMVLDAARTKVGAGGRFRRIYLEEMGLISNLKDIHKSNKDSLRLGKKRVGSQIGIGTGGDMTAIRQPKDMFENPDGYDVFSIPNYWSKKMDKRIGLFIPSYYKYSDYRDENGNSDLEAGYKYIIREREKLLTESDSVSYESELMNNPIVPAEMLRPSGGSILPKQEALNQLESLNNYDIFKNRAMIGSLKYSPDSDRGVVFTRDTQRKLQPILTYDIPNDMISKTGAFIMYEQPPEIIPDNLYYVVYDPIMHENEGSSLSSILVYKGYYSGAEDTMYDAIVAEWIGRYDKGDDNHHMAIKMAKFFNARVFPEVNVPGFITFCRDNGFYHLLEQEANYLEREINPKARSNPYKIGVRMDKRKKQWAIQQLRDYLMEPRGNIDPITGVAKGKAIDWVLSPRLLDEIINFNDNDNFDHLSAAFVLMILRGKLAGRPPIELDYSEDQYFDRAGDNFLDYQLSVSKKNRSAFLNY